MVWAVVNENNEDLQASESAAVVQDCVTAPTGDDDFSRYVSITHRESDGVKIGST